VDTAAAAAAARSPPRPAPPRTAEWSRALQWAPRQIPRGFTRNAHTALSTVGSSRAERSIGGRLPPEAPEDATREARLGKGLETSLYDTERGGETACYAHLVCPECGAVLDGGAHASGCSGKA
jgi:hypothetical protein